MISERTIEVAIELVKKELNRVNEWVAEARATGAKSPRYFEDMANRREKLLAAQDELIGLSHRLRERKPLEPDSLA